MGSRRIFAVAGFCLAFFLAFSIFASSASAWWNETYYPYRYLFKSNATFVNYSSTMPVHLNDSAGICGKDYIAGNCTSGDSCYVYCQNSGCCNGLVAFANETKVLAYYNASNMTGYNPTSVYNSNYSVVYNLGGGTGAVNTSDATANAKHATLQSMTESNWVAGKFGYALDFDGATDWVNISEAWTVINYTHGTFMAWAYRDDWSETQVAASKILSIYDEDNDNIEIGYIAGTTTIRFGRYTPAGWNSGACFTGVNATGLHNNEWHHFAMTWSGTSFTSCYIDGVLAGTGANAGVWTGDGKPQYDYALGQWAPPNGLWWDGYIDEVKILGGIPLTDAEIKMEFENGGGGNYQTGNLTALGVEGVPPALSGPTFSNQLASPSSPQNYNYTYGSFGFQTDCLKCNDIVFEANFKGTATNYTTQIKNISTTTYWINFTQSNMTVAVHNYRWYGWNATGWVKDTQYSYTINQANSTKGISLSLDGNVSIAQNRTYPNATHFMLAENNTGDDACTYSTKENGTDQSLADYTKTLAARDYNITAFTDGCANFTAGQTSVMLTIGKGSTTLYLAINSTEGDAAYPYGAVTNATAWKTLSGGTQSLLRNGTAASNPDILQLAARSYNYTTNMTHENYTAPQVERFVVISKKVTNVTLYMNGTQGNLSTTYPSVTNQTAITNVSGPTFYLYRNGTTVSSGTDKLTDITQYAAYRYNFTAAYPGDENNTASYQTFWLNVSRGDASGALSVDPGWSVAENTQVTITATAGIGYTLFRDGINVSSPYIAVFSFGIYNFTLMLADAENYTNPATTQYLTVSSGGFGCTNNMTFAFYKVITTEYNYTVLNFSTLLANSMVRSNLTDVYVNTTALESSPSIWRNGTLLIVNTTIQKTFTVKFGNYIGNWSWSSSPMPANYTNDTLTTYSEYPYYYILMFLEETTGVQQLPPNANRTLSLFCSNGVSSFSINHSKILVATFAPVQQARTSVSYSVTEVYSRNLILTSNIEYKNVYLVDAEKNQVVQMLIELQDYTGDFDNAIFRVKKSLEGSLQTITENYFDAENKVLIYLINGDQYSIYIDNGIEERSMGNFYVDSVDLTKTLSIGDIYNMNFSSMGNISYRLYRRNATGYNDAIIFAYLDAAGQTRNVTMQVFNYTNVSQLLYTTSSLNHSTVYFFYDIATVADVNGSYIVRIHVNHTQFGENSWDWEEAFQAFVGVVLIPGLLPTIFPATYVQAMAFILIMGIPMLFSPPHGATAGVYVVLIAALLSFWNWYPINIAILIFGLAIAVLNKMRSRT